MSSGLDTNLDKFTDPASISGESTSNATFIELSKLCTLHIDNHLKSVSDRIVFEISRVLKDQHEYLHKLEQFKSKYKSICIKIKQYCVQEFNLDVSLVL